MATTKSILQTNKRIKRQNENFDDMTDEQKRVAIAQDVIAQINAKRYFPVTGSYVGGVEIVSKPVSVFSERANCHLPQAIDVKSVLNADMISCSVCAKGAMFVAAIERFNNYQATVYDQNQVLNKLAGDGYKVTNHLSQYFSWEQLSLIEYAFEGGRHGSPENDDQIPYVEKLYRKYRDADERMLVIMRSIVKNNGTFVCDASLLKIKPNPIRKAKKAKARSR